MIVAVEEFNFGPGVEVVVGCEVNVEVTVVLLLDVDVVGKTLGPGVVDDNVDDTLDIFDNVDKSDDNDVDNVDVVELTLGPGVVSIVDGVDDIEVVVGPGFGPGVVNEIAPAFVDNDELLLDSVVGVVCDV